MTDWAPGPFEDGREARYGGFDRDECPSADAIGRFARQSWLAGWDDADADVKRMARKWAERKPPSGDIHGTPLEVLAEPDVLWWLNTLPPTKGSR